MTVAVIAALLAVCVWALRWLAPDHPRGVLTVLDYSPVAEAERILKGD